MICIIVFVKNVGFVGENLVNLEVDWEHHFTIVSIKIIKALNGEAVLAKPLRAYYLLMINYDLYQIPVW